MKISADLVLWVLQALLALAFLGAGVNPLWATNGWPHSPE